MVHYCVCVIISVKLIILNENEKGLVLLLIVRLSRALAFFVNKEESSVVECMINYCKRSSSCWRCR